MAEDWSIDVKKYVPDADDGVIAAIVRYCGIALQSRDASLVSFTDPVETGRVRENYCKKKLGLTDPDEVLDSAIAAVGERMKGDSTRNRVTVYYLLAEHFGKLGLFGAVAAAAPAVAAPVVAEPPPPPPPAAPVPPVMAAAAAAPIAAAAIPKAVLKKDDGGVVRTALWALAGLAAILGIGYLGTLIGDRVDRDPIAAPPAPASPVTAPVAVAPAIPEGAGLIAVEEEGKPKLSVYFDTAKADVTPDLPNEVGPLKAYMEANPTARLGVSGFNDPRGNAAFNAELSKNRAQNVAAALAGLGLPADRIDLIKPVDTTDDVDTLEVARRVDVYVQQ